MIGEGKKYSLEEKPKSMKVTIDFKHYPYLLDHIDEDSIKMMRNRPNVILHFLAERYKQGPYKVMLINYGTRKIHCIKLIREVNGISLKDAKELADKIPGLPQCIVSGPFESCKGVADLFKKEGFEVEITDYL